MKPTGLFRCFRIAAFLSALAASTSASSVEVTIGWGGPKTPEHAIVLQRSAQLAIDEANGRNLSINGEKLHFRLEPFDDKDSPNFAAIAARSFINNKVSAVIGHYSTESSIAAAKIYAEADIPMITVFAASPKLTRQNLTNVFQLVGNIEAATSYMTSEFTAAKKAKHVAVAYGDSSIGNIVADAIDNALKRRGSSLSARIAINSKTSDFNEVLTLVNQKDIDIIYFAGFHQQGLALSTRLQSEKMKAHLMLSGALFNPDFFSNTGGYADGSMILLHTKPEKQLPGFSKFEKAYQDKFHKPPMPYAANAYDAANMIIQAVLQSRSTAPKKISEQLHDMTYNGLTGTIKFDVFGSLINPNYTMYQAEQKQWKVFRTFP